MNRRRFLSASAGAAGLASAQSTVPTMQQVHPGVWKFHFGVPEKITPVTTRHYPPAEAGLRQLPAVAQCPVKVTGKASPRGYLVSMPLAPWEMVYGLGLQLQSFLQRGLKKKLRVNADPQIDSGDSHAPVPFYVTTSGYGVLIDTARYATIYCGNKRRKSEGPAADTPAGETAGQNGLPGAYDRFHFERKSEVLVEIREAQGVDVYVFGGPEMRHAVQRYNLFSGGGALPPKWGLGNWYRVRGEFQQSEVLQLAAEFRDRKIPCDVLGLEPGWQTHAYSCTFVWSKKFPDPAAMVRQLTASNYRVNLWEHAFTNPASPLYQPLLPLSGDFEVWGGLVPDFLLPEARRIFADFHEKTHVAIGVSGYKLDECDNSDFTRNWSFPEISTFPSGADGEQMHCLFGLRYQDTIQSIFERRKQRTYGLVRSSQALAAPYPYVLYSDLYDHREFIRGLANAGFSGLLWTPELRDARNTEDLVRRLQSVVLSPMALINGWYIQNPPWKQVDREKNNAGEFSADWEQVEARCRAALELRMKLLPYLHAAFVRYWQEGRPPFRALVLDYPGDRNTWPIDDQYLMGEHLMVAPAFAGHPERKVYLPAGGWFDFWTGQRYEGGRQITVRPPLDQIPMFVKDGSVLPLAEAGLHAGDAGAGNLHVYVYGDGLEDATLFEEDGGWDPKIQTVTLGWDSAGKNVSLKRTPNGVAEQFRVVEWKAVN